MNILFSQSNTPAFNLAAEEFLFSKTDDDFLFLYVNEPSVILGSNQAVINEVDLDYCIEQEVRILRRLSGGGAVFHDAGNLNYSFINNKSGEPLSARFLDPVVATLHSMEIPVEIGKRKDLWLEGRKISGTASHLSRGREIHHGTLLYDTDLEVLSKVLNPQKRDIVSKATASVPSPVVNIRSYLQKENRVDPDPAHFFEWFTHQMLLTLGVAQVTHMEESILAEIGKLQREKYSQRSWNYRM